MAAIKDKELRSCDTIRVICRSYAAPFLWWRLRKPMATRTLRRA